MSRIDGNVYLLCMYMRSIVCKENNGKMTYCSIQESLLDQALNFYFIYVNNMLQISWVDLCFSLP